MSFTHIEHEKTPKILKKNTSKIKSSLTFENPNVSNFDPLNEYMGDRSIEEDSKNLVFVTSQGPTINANEIPKLNSQDNSGIKASGSKNLKSTTILAAQQNAKPIYKRKRNFRVCYFKKIHLFEGYPYIQYDSQTRRDPYMQKIIFRDQLLIFLDKLYQLKVILSEKAKFIKIFENKKEHTKVLKRINLFIEEVMGMVEQIIEFLVGSEIESLNEVGAKPNPLTQEEKNLEFHSEIDIFASNILILPGFLDHFKDAVEAFFIFCRQKDRKPLSDDKVHVVLQIMERGRYQIGDIIEELRQIETSFNQNQTLYSVKKTR